MIILLHIPMEPISEQKAKMTRDRTVYTRRLITDGQNYEFGFKVFLLFSETGKMHSLH